MPIISSSYVVPWWGRNPHFQTVWARFGRPKPSNPVRPRRERFETHDHDFFDVDWYPASPERGIVLLLHGLEGSSASSYITSMVSQLLRNDYTCGAINFRGCSGEPNSNLTSYHSGFTEDLRSLVFVLRSRIPALLLSLIGFSVGGNIVLKYLGEEGVRARESIGRAVTLSVPCDLEDAALALSRRRTYMRYFLRSLRKKLEDKGRLFPGKVSLTGYSSIRTFQGFDDRFTAPMHGYHSAKEYWAAESSLPFLPNISVPTLLLSSLDDPFLGPKCFPFQTAEMHPYLFLECPSHGGHVAFLDGWVTSWAEKRAVQFIGEDQ